MAFHLAATWSSSADPLISADKQKEEKMREREKGWERDRGRERMGNCTGGFRARLEIDSHHFFCPLSSCLKLSHMTTPNSTEAGNSFPVCAGRKHRVWWVQSIVSASNIHYRVANLWNFSSLTFPPVEYENSYVPTPSIIKRKTFFVLFSVDLHKALMLLYTTRLQISVFLLWDISLRSGPSSLESQDSISDCFPDSNPHLYLTGWPEFLGLSLPVLLSPPSLPCCRGRGNVQKSATWATLQEPCPTPLAPHIPDCVVHSEAWGKDSHSAFSGPSQVGSSLHFHRKKVQRTELGRQNTSPFRLGTLTLTKPSSALSLALSVPPK